MRVVIAGGTGFVGRHVVKAFHSRGDEVVVLSRKTANIPGASIEIWNGETLGEWTGIIQGAGAVINLSGTPVTLRWNDENRRDILESRVKSTELIGRAIRACKTPPRVWVNASAAGYYGDQGDEHLTESSPAGVGFLAETCLAWEKAQVDAETPGVRKVRIRTGIALGNDGGALPELAKFARLFLGGAQGSGRQWMPWVHAQDLAGMFRWAVDSEFEGSVNGVGVEPVQNGEFMATLRRQLGRPWAPPAPSFALRAFGALAGMQADVVLQSQRVKSSVLVEAKFPHRFSELGDALEDLLPKVP